MVRVRAVIIGSTGVQNDRPNAEDRTTTMAWRYAPRCRWLDSRPTRRMPRGSAPARARQQPPVTIVYATLLGNGPRRGRRWCRRPPRWDCRTEFRALTPRPSFSRQPPRATTIAVRCPSRELEAHRCSRACGCASPRSRGTGWRGSGWRGGIQSFPLLSFAPGDRTPQPLTRPGDLDLQLKRGRDIKVPKGGLSPLAPTKPTSLASVARRGPSGP